MKTKSLFLVIFLGLIVNTSCNKEDLFLNSENKVSSENVKLTGVAHFSSQAQFDNSVELFRNEGVLPPELYGVNSLANSLSLKSAKNEELYEEEDTLVISDLFREFLNDRYEIVIGDVFIRITEQGTFFTKVENGNWLRNLEISDKTIEFVSLVTSALGYFNEHGMYSVDKYENLFVFDTFRKIDPFKEELDIIDMELLKSASPPSNIEWRDIDDGRTLAGRAWDEIWGFSKSVRNYFDSRHRVDVKFYAQRFLVYSEVGIKTKTQMRGWTGLWRKQDSDEIINGWEILNLKEEWPRHFFGSNFNPNNNTFPDFYFQNQAAKDLAFNQSVFANKPWITFNIMGLELNFSQKDKLGALWNAAKFAGKVTVSYLNGRFRNPNNSNEAIRLIPQNIFATSTNISLAPYSERRSSTDKFTMIIDSSSGGRITVFISGGTFGYSEFANLSAKYTFLPNTIMYGAARRGTAWRGVRITFK